MPVINSVAFKRLHKLSADQTLSLSDIAHLSGFPKAALQEVYNRGIGAYKTNPSSVRPQVKSKEQWAMARVYSFVMKRKPTFHGSDNDVRVKYNLK